MTMEVIRCPHCGQGRLSELSADPDLQIDPEPPTPELSPGLEKLRRKCVFGIEPTRTESGWTWVITDQHGRLVDVLIDHNPENHDQRLWDFLTGYSLGMNHIPF